MADGKRDYLKEKRELEQLVANAVLRDDEGLWRERTGSTVSVAVLKAVLNALLCYYPNMFPGLKLIEQKCGFGTRTLKRAIQVLQTKEILAVEATRNGGRTQNRYTILTTKLSYLGGDGRLPLFKEPGAMVTEPGATRNKPGAMVTEPGATDGPLTRNSTRKESLKTNRHGAGDSFSFEDRERHLPRFERIAAVVRPKKGTDQAVWMMMVCLWVDVGTISEAQFEDSLESSKRNKRGHFGYLHKCIKNKIEHNGHNYNELVTNTKEEIRQNVH